MQKNGIHFHGIYSSLTAEEFDQIIEIVKQLKRTFERSHHLLMLTIYLPTKFVARPQQLSILSRYVDYISVVPKPIIAKNFKGALFDINISSIQEKIGKFVDSGVAQDKTLMFLSTYGILLQKGDAEVLEDFVAYNEICLMIAEGGWREWNGRGMTFFHNNATQMTILLVSTRTIANQVRFAMQKGLIGFYVNNVLNDDFTRNCGVDADTFDDFHSQGDHPFYDKIPTQKDTTFPILRTISTAMKVTLDEIEKETALQLAQNSSTENQNEIGKGAAAKMVFNTACVCLLISAITIQF